MTVRPTIAVSIAASAAKAGISSDADHQGWPSFTKRRSSTSWVSPATKLMLANIKMVGNKPTEAPVGEEEKAGDLAKGATMGTYATEGVAHDIDAFLESAGQQDSDSDEPMGIEGECCGMEIEVVESDGERVVNFKTIRTAATMLTDQEKEQLREKMESDDDFASVASVADAVPTETVTEVAESVEEPSQDATPLVRQPTVASIEKGVRAIYENIRNPAKASETASSTPVISRSPTPEPVLEAQPDSESSSCDDVPARSESYIQKMNRMRKARVENAVSHFEAKSKPAESKFFSLADYEQSKRTETAVPSFMKATAKSTSRKASKRMGRGARLLARSKSVKIQRKTAAKPVKPQPVAEVVPTPEEPREITLEKPEKKIESKLFSLADYEAQKRSRVSKEKPSYLRATRKTSVRIAARKKRTLERQASLAAAAKPVVKPLRKKPVRAKKPKRKATRKARV